MAQHVLIALEMPPDLEKFKLPQGVNERLHALLDRQDRGAGLTPAARTEAAGTVADTTRVAGRLSWAMRSLPAEFRRLVMPRAVGPGLSISSGKVSLAWVCPLMVARRLPRWPCTACASWPSERQKQRLGVIPRVQPTKIHG